MICYFELWNCFTKFFLLKLLKACITFSPVQYLTVRTNLILFIFKTSLPKTFALVHSPIKLLYDSRATFILHAIRTSSSCFQQITATKSSGGWTGNVPEFLVTRDTFRRRDASSWMLSRGVKRGWSNWYGYFTEGSLRVPFSLQVSSAYTGRFRNFLQLEVVFRSPVI